MYPWYLDALRVRGDPVKQVFAIKEPVGAIKSPTDLFSKIKTINIDYKQENFILICLDTKHGVLHSEILFKGGLNSSVIDLRTLFRIALRHNSDSIIIAHNHPSGNLKPSGEDCHVFNMVKRAGDIIGLKCLDSIIFNESEFYSMTEVK